MQESHHHEDSERSGSLFTHSSAIQVQCSLTTGRYQTRVTAHITSILYILPPPHPTPYTEEWLSWEVLTPTALEQSNPLFLPSTNVIGQISSNNPMYLKQFFACITPTSM